MSNARAPFLAFPALAVLIGLLAGCRAPGRSGRSGAVDPFADAPTGIAPAASGSSTGSPATESPASATATLDAPVAEIDPGVYAGDDRFLGLAASFAERVRAASDRLGLATGLTFRDRAAPRVLLTALRDETRAHRLSAEIVAGRRRVLLSINAEPLVVGRAHPDRVLLAGLAAAAVTDFARRDRLPPWFAVFVGLLASGDAADRVTGLARSRVRGRELPRVEPLEPECADATGLAVTLLLASRGRPSDVRHWIDRVVDGDDPAPSIARLLGEVEGDWVASARRTLSDAVDDAEADEGESRRLVEAARALDELGPAGLSDVLERAIAGGTPSSEFLAEADALRLRAAIGSGDAVAARDVLARRPPEAPALGALADPGRYLLDAARAERFAGGSALTAWERLVRFDRDFPRHPDRAEAFDEMLAWLGKLPPDLEVRLIDRVVRERGTTAIDAPTATRRVEALLGENRPGAAERFVASLGARGDAGDLADARAAILAATTDPSPLAIAVHRARAEAFLSAPTSAAEAEIVDGGGPGADALGARAATLVEPLRGRAIRLLVRAGGLARAVAALLPSDGRAWVRRAEDLTLLSGEVGYADLRRTVTALDPTPADDPSAVLAWRGATFDLAPEILAGDDLLLTRLRSPEFATRRAAFEALLDDEGTSGSPMLVRHMARDPATLLRRRAVLAAGRVGLVDVARTGFDDPSWIVRSAAASALAEARDDASVPRLEAVVADAGTDVRVRASAAAALLRFAERGSARFRPIVALLRADDPTLADAVARALAPESSAALGRALASELASEALGAGARLDRGALFRLFVAYRRATGRDAGYDPSLDAAAVRALVAGLPELRSARADPAPR